MGGFVKSAKSMHREHSSNRELLAFAGAIFTSPSTATVTKERHEEQTINESKLEQINNSGSEGARNAVAFLESMNN